jgi:hypothetical protein
MIKKETFELLRTISTFYDQFLISQEKVNLWHEVFKHYQPDVVQENLFAFVKESPFPPKIADLLPKSSQGRTVPNAGETRVIITARHKPASKAVIQQELANMREILGIRR